MAKRQIKIDREVAELEFQNFIDAMDIDLDMGVQDEDDKRQDTLAKERIIKAVMYGDLVFNDNDEPVYTPWRNSSTYREPLTFHERTAATLTAGDNKGKNADAKRLYAMMGQLCRVPASTFQGLAGSDLKVCEAIGALLIV